MSEERAFLPEILDSIEDIDAALSNVALDYLGSATEYLARVTAKFFLRVSQPALGDSQDAWASIRARLKSSSLVLIPALPSPAEAAANGTVLAVVGYPLVRLRGTAKGLEWGMLSPEEEHAIRDADLQEIIQRNRERCTLTIDGAHFELPSGAHTTHFVRFAECLADIETVDRLVFWIARHHQTLIEAVPHGQSVVSVVDHPSLLVVGVRLAQVFPSSRMVCRCLAAYPESADAAAEMREWLEKLPSDLGLLLMVVSISSTGSLARMVTGACEELNIPADVSTLYQTTERAQEVAFCLLVLENYEHFHDMHACAICSRGETTVFRIDRARYFLHERRIRKVALPPKIFEPSKPFLEQFGGKNGVLLTHVRDPNDVNPRHHAFYVSVHALLQCSDFVEQLIAAILDMKPAVDLVVVPNHPIGHELADLLRVKVAIPVVLHNDLRLDPNDASHAPLLQTIVASKHLLIVDDLSFSGRRIQAYNRALREGHFETPDTVTFFPLIVLCESADAWARVVRGIVDHHGEKRRFVRFMYDLPLPDWDERKCPWCVERKQLEALPAFADEIYNIRGAKLQQLSGLGGDAWVSTDKPLPTLGKSSPILPQGSNSIQVLFSCAAAVQRARTHQDPARRLDPEGFPHSGLLHESVFAHFQNEMLLNVCLLRSIRPSELSNELRAHLAEKLARLQNLHELHDAWALGEFEIARRRGMLKGIVLDAGPRSIAGLPTRRIRESLRLAFAKLRTCLMPFA
jgi:hypothetical protein